MPRHITFWVAKGILVLAAMLVVSGAKAMNFTLYNPCEGNNTLTCQPRILGTGVIVVGDAKKLRRMVDAWSKKAVDGLSGITFHSPGGNLYEGVRIGQEIRKIKMDTFATVRLSAWDSPGGREKVLVEKMHCMSACVYAFAGGFNRKIEPGSILGVHQFASVAPNQDSESKAQVTTTLLRAYLEEMGVRPELLDVASLKTASELHILSPNDIKGFRLDNTARQATGWSIIALSNGTPLLMQTAEMYIDQDVTVSLYRSGNSFVLRLNIVSGDEPTLLSIFPVGRHPDVEIWADDILITAEPHTEWRQQPGVSRGFTSSVRLKLSDVEAIARSQDVILKDNCGGRRLAGIVPYDLTLSSKGLTEGIQLLRRAN